jgi:O-antigen ligase
MIARARGLTLLQLSVLAAAAVFGVLAAIQPVVALAAAAACAFAYVVFADLAVGFAILMFLSFLEILPTSGSLSPAKGAGLLLALAWLARVSRRERSEQAFSVAHPHLAWGMIAFVGWGALTLLWAPAIGVGLNGLFQYSQVLLLLPIAYMAVRSKRDLMVVLFAIVLGAVVAAAVGIVQPPNAAVIESTRATGTIGDANELAAALLVGLALGLGFVLARGSPITLRLGGLLAAPVCALGIFLSVSRGGLVSLAVMFVVGTVTAGRWRAAMTAVLVAVGVGGVLYFTQLAPLPARERVLRFNGGSGRTDLWTVGLRMVRSHPFEGVGIGNFQQVSSHYALQPGLLQEGQFIFSAAPKVAHNAYLQVLSEMGIPGLLLFGGVILTGLTCALRAARIAAEHNDVGLEALSRAVFFALIGMLAAEFFISQEHSKLLWGLLALSPAMLAIARREAAAGVRKPQQSEDVEPAPYSERRGVSSSPEAAR